MLGKSRTFDACPMSFERQRVVENEELRQETLTALERTCLSAQGDFQAAYYTMLTTEQSVENEMSLETCDLAVEPESVKVAESDCTQDDPPWGTNSI